MVSILKKFGEASGLEINALKSRLIFPKSLHLKLRHVLSHSIHIPTSTSFGKYLGIPLVSHEPKMASFEVFLINVSKSLIGWQTKFKNFAR